MSCSYFCSISALNLLGRVRSIGCSERASGLDNGKTYLFKCDSKCGSSVYGCPKNNGWVTSDSSICSAARMLAIPLHSSFTLVRSGRQNSYASCTMNGHRSHKWGSYGGSYRIELSGRVRNIGCSERASGLDTGRKYLFKCDSSCGSSIWGCPKNNGWVTSDSSICTAARMLAIPLHSPFTLVRSGRQISYASCTMNGQRSRKYGSYGGSYRIEAGGKSSSLKKVHYVIYKISNNFVVV